MSRRLILTTAACSALAVGGTGWWLASRPTISLDELPEVVTSINRGRSELLGEARLLGMPGLDTFVTEQLAIVEDEPDRAEAWRVLAEAYFERRLQRDSSLGMRIGEPAHSKLPQGHAQDIEAGLAAVERCRELLQSESAAPSIVSESESSKSPDPQLDRIEAGLLTGQIVGIASALRVAGKIDRLLKRALETDPGDARLQVSVACRQLFAPSWLGGDPASALPVFKRAAEALPHDERPLLFGSMAAFLIGKLDESVDLIQRAATRNPNNRFARAVAERLAAKEDDPFGRDLDD